MAKDNEDVELQADGPDEPAARRTEQHPALKGTEEGVEAEVEQRSVDNDDDPGRRFVKTFLVDGDASELPEDSPMHEANKAVVLEEAIQRGLHPRGDVSLDSAEPRRVGDEPGRRTHVSTVLTYSVQTVPAIVDREPNEATTPRDQVESDDGSTSTPKPKSAAAQRGKAATSRGSSRKR